MCSYTACYLAQCVIRYTAYYLVHIVFLRSMLFGTVCSYTACYLAHSVFLHNVVFGTQCVLTECGIWYSVFLHSVLFGTVCSYTACCLSQCALTQRVSWHTVLFCIQCFYTWYWTQFVTGQCYLTHRVLMHCYLAQCVPTQHVSWHKVCYYTSCYLMVFPHSRLTHVNSVLLDSVLTQHYFRTQCYYTVFYSTHCFYPALLATQLVTRHTIGPSWFTLIVKSYLIFVYHNYCLSLPATCLGTTHVAVLMWQYANRECN
jgi:hypothetical protein